MSAPDGYDPGRWQPTPIVHVEVSVHNRPTLVTFHDVLGDECARSASSGWEFRRTATTTRYVLAQRITDIEQADTIPAGQGVVVERRTVVHYDGAAGKAKALMVALPIEYVAELIERGWVGS